MSFRAPQQYSPHRPFYDHLLKGGIVFRDDKTNGKQEWIDIRTLGGDAAEIQRYGYLNLQMVKYVVVEEDTLGYFIPYPNTSSFVGILAAKVSSGRSWLDGMFCIVFGKTNMRPATASDFAKFRVSPPPEFYPGQQRIADMKASSLNAMPSQCSYAW